MIVFVGDVENKDRDKGRLPLCFRSELAVGESRRRLEVAKRLSHVELAGTPFVETGSGPPRFLSLLSASILSLNTC